MNSILQRYSGSSAGGLSKSAIDEDNDFSDAMWGSQAGFGTLTKGVPGFVVPSVPDVGLLLLLSAQLKTTLAACRILEVTHR
jgi:20S proteasome subunit beta 5